MNKVEIFKEELNCIKNPKIKDFAEKAVNKLPDYFFTVAASSTGKYHPSYALGDGGLVRHTKAAVRIAVELFRVDMFKYDDDTKDLIVVALILHDGKKHGNDYSKYTVANHPVVAKEWLEQDDELNSLLPEKQFRIITNGIISHMGQWNSDYKTKKEIMPRPSTGIQNFIHLADYLASRKCLELNFDIEVNRE